MMRKDGKLPVKLVLVVDRPANAAKSTCPAQRTVYVQYTPANKERLFGVSLRLLFVGPTPGHFPVSGFLFTESFESFLHVHAYVERVFSY